MRPDVSRRPQERVKPASISSKDVKSLRHKQLYEFGPFRIDTALNRVERGGEAIPLPPKAFDLLDRLVRVFTAARSTRLVPRNVNSGMASRRAVTERSDGDPAGRRRDAGGMDTRLAAHCPVLAGRERALDKPYAGRDLQESGAGTGEADPAGAEGSGRAVDKQCISMCRSSAEAMLEQCLLNAIRIRIRTYVQNEIWSSFSGVCFSSACRLCTLTSTAVDVAI